MFCAFHAIVLLCFLSSLEKTANLPDPTPRLLWHACLLQAEDGAKSASQLIGEETASPQTMIELLAHTLYCRQLSMLARLGAVARCRCWRRLRPVNCAWRIICRRRTSTLTSKLLLIHDDHSARRAAELPPLPPLALEPLMSAEHWPATASLGLLVAPGASELVFTLPVLHRHRLSAGPCARPVSGLRGQLPCLPCLRQARWRRHSPPMRHTRHRWLSAPKCGLAG